MYRKLHSFQTSRGLPNLNTLTLSLASCVCSLYKRSSDTEKIAKSCQHLCLSESFILVIFTLALCNDHILSGLALILGCGLGFGIKALTHGSSNEQRTFCNLKPTFSIYGCCNI